MNNMEIKQSKVVVIAQNVEKFWKSKLSELMVALVFLTLLVVQLLLFGFNITNPNAGDSTYKDWEVWTVIIVTSIGGGFSLYGTIFSIRGKNKFFKYQVISSSLFIVSDIILHLLYDMIRNIMFVYLFYLRKVEWSKQQKEGKSEVFKPAMLNMVDTAKYFIAGGLIFAGLGTAMYFTSNWADTVNVVWLQDPYAYLDAYMLTFSMLGATLLIKKNVQGWYAFASSDIVSVILWCFLGAYSSMVMSLMFLTLDISTIIIWTHLFKQQNKK